MTEFNLFLIEAGISFATSGTVIFFLYKSLYRLLVDSCGTETRAKFWVVYTNIMLVIAPLLTSIVFGKSRSSGEADFVFYKTALGCALFGVFFSLAVIGMQINKSIPKPEGKNAST